MKVNSLKLPTQLAQLINSGRAAWVAGLPNWMLKEERDAFGHPWETGNELELYSDLAKIKTETDYLPVEFKLANRTSEEIDRGNAFSAREHGFIPFIIDFSKIIRIGRNGEGHACCLDYRSDLEKPSVIFWDDYYWRRVAPDFDTFMRLFDPYDGIEYLRRYSSEALPGILIELSEQAVVDEPPGR
jgi:hypothetical protein